MKRPWGEFENLEENKNYKVKRLVVWPGKRLSLQKHNHRSEHWVVVKGKAKVTLDEEVFTLEQGKYVFIELGKKHRLENPGKDVLEVIEVQVGNYCREDDIERFSDDYGRAE